MKIFCRYCGAHFLQDFDASLKCGFWNHYPLSIVPEECRIEFWDWMLTSPFDKAFLLTGAQFTIILHATVGEDPGKNDWPNLIENYGELPEPEQQQKQKEYIKRREELIDLGLKYEEMMKAKKKQPAS